MDNSIPAYHPMSWMLIWPAAPQLSFHIALRVFMESSGERRDWSNFRHEPGGETGTGEIEPFRSGLAQWHDRSTSQSRDLSHSPAQAAWRFLHRPIADALALETVLGRAGLAAAD